MTFEAFSIPQIFGLLVFPAAMIAAALCDLFTLKIPNKLSALLVLGFVPAAFLAHLSWPMVGYHVATAAAALAFGIFAFAMRWIGGGDGKFLAACALWFGPHDILVFSVAFSFVGGFLALLLLTMRRVPLPAMLARQAWILRLWDREVGVPYALAFAAGALLVYPQSALWQQFMAG